MLELTYIIFSLLYFLLLLKAGVKLMGILEVQNK